MKTTLLLLSFLVGAATALARSPKLNSTTPAGGTRGTELELTFNGARLDDAQEIVLYGPGIDVLKIESAQTNAVKARVRIAPDCRLGEHALRVRTATGVSDLRTFFVGPFPTVKEAEPNNEPAQAQKLSLNTTVQGTAGGEDLDCYRLEARQGQRLAVEVEAIRLGRAMLDPYVAIVDETGKVLATADDTSLLMQDAALSLVAPADGVYLVQVRESTFTGAADSPYRLHVGTFPRPLAVYPAGGKAGETLKVTFIGDAAGEFSQEFQLPGEPREKHGVFAERDGQTAPSPNWLRVSPFPNAVESEPNDRREEAAAASPAPEAPVALNGILGKAGDADWFRFRAKKGVALEAHVFARRVRSPVDSVLQIFDAKGNSLAQNDDAAGADSSVRFTPSEDGEYFARVNDHLRRGGPDFVYRVEIAPAQPNVSLNIPQVARNDSQSRQFIAVPRGNRFATMISAKRSQFSGDLVFDLADLPAGITMHADPMAAKVDAQPLVFEAAADAPLVGKLLDLVARPAETGKELRSAFRHDVEFIPGPNNTFYYQTRVDKLYVAVVEAAPFKIHLEEPKVPLVQGGSMDLRIVAERDAGFEEPINVKMMWNPPGLGSLPDVTIPKDTNCAVYRINANGGADLRKWKIAVLGSATVKGGPLFVSSQLAELEVAEPYVKGKIETVSTSPGQPVKLVCKLEQKKPFAGKAVMRVVGLPDKISAPEVEITKDDTEAVFQLAVDPKCPTGSFKNLFCSVELKENDQVIPHAIATGGVLRVVPPKKPETKVAATAKAN